MTVHRKNRAVRRGPQETLDLTITALGAQGDGIAAHGGEKLFVPFTLPGDGVTARRIGPHHAIPIAWHAKAPAHAAPACPHFGTCGGCALQHLNDDAYAAWKIELLMETLAHRGFTDVKLQPLARTPPAARRRADLGVARTGDRVAIGFHAYKSRQLVDLQACPVLEPALFALLPALRGLLTRLLADGQTADILATRTESGMDLLFRHAKAPDQAAREAIIAFAQEQDIARVAWQRATEPAEIIVQRRVPRVTFGAVAVELPPGAFLQASPQGERAIVDEVCKAASGARRIIDLYAGCGTLTFPLARSARVRAVEGAKDLAASLDMAARRANLGGRIAVETRDLMRRPLLPEELDGADAVVFDPPRDGAGPQAAAIARARVPNVIAVSCNPATFARDARILADGGYRLLSVTPVDQFLWSPHLELVASFRR